MSFSFVLTSNLVVSLSRGMSLKHIIVFDCVNVTLLSQTRDMLLSCLPIILSSLYFSELGIVQFITIDEEIFVYELVDVWSLNSQVDIKLVIKLDITSVNMLKVLSFEINSYDTLTNCVE
jgi:hypothetical protein